MVSEPGLAVTRPIGPPGVSGPAATPAVAFQAGDLGRAGAGVDRRQSGSGAIGLRRCEGSVAQVPQDAELTGDLVGDHEVEQAVARCIDCLDVGDAQAHGNRHGRQELWGHEPGIDWTDELGTEEDRERAVRGVADDQVGPPSPFRLAAMICVGSRPVASDPTFTKPSSR